MPEDRLQLQCRRGVVRHISEEEEHTHPSIVDVELLINRTNGIGIDGSIEVHTYQHMSAYLDPSKD
jgi:hypothetical protein